MTARLVDVSHRFASRWALARLTLDIPEGKAILLTGENGAGKTTLLRVLATAIRPTRGEVFLFGMPATDQRDAVRVRLGLVTHQNYLYDALSARENLDLVARLLGHGSSRAARIRTLLEHVGLTPHAKRAVGGFSAGMKRRLCFARLLLSEARLALLDEPFGQLDPEGVELVANLIRELKAAGTTLIMSTHDIERGLSLCDLHLKLSSGRQAAPLSPIAKVTELGGAAATIGTVAS